MYEVYPGRQILIMTTSQCDAPCEHRSVPFVGHFAPDELYEIVQNLQKQGYRVFLDGAEPLVERGYLKSFRLANQKIVSTNGLSIASNSQFVYDIREAGIETVGVSYHFDIQQQLSKVSPSLAEAALKIVELAGMKARVLTTITRPYLEKIPEYCAWCVKNGFREIRFANYISQEGAALSPDDRRRYYEIISEQREKYPVDALRILSCGSFGFCGTFDMTCMAARDCVVLAPDKKVYSCFFQMRPESECGYYKDDQIFVKEKTVSHYNCSAHCLCLFND